MENRENPNPNISDDILITNILPRLPPKSLIRFKIVCKQWRSIISNPNFIESNLQLSKTNHNNNGVLVRSISKSSSRKRVVTLTYISYDDFSTTDFHLATSKFGIDYPNYYPNFYVLGSCNGLQCCWLNGGLICVWNPITSECRQIPNPPMQYICQCVSGFGYIPSLDDYKLVILELSDVIRVHCYTLRSCDSEWKQLHYEDIVDKFGLGRISPLYTYLCPSYLSPGIVLTNSKSHWLVRYNIDGYSYHDEDELIILGFDMETDTFNTVKPPEEIIRVWYNYGVDTCLSSINDNLCIACEVVSGCLQVWKLERYGDSSSWNKFLKLNNVESPTSSSNFFTSYESKEGVKFLTYSTSNVWSLYLKSKSDHQITQHEWFGVKPSLFCQYSVPTVLYVESLVSPFMTDQENLGYNY